MKAPGPRGSPAPLPLAGAGGAHRLPTLPAARLVTAVGVTEPVGPGVFSDGPGQPVLANKSSAGPKAGKSLKLLGLGALGWGWSGQRDAGDVCPAAGSAQGSSNLLGRQTIEDPERGTLIRLP